MLTPKQQALVVVALGRAINAICKETRVQPTNEQLYAHLAAMNSVLPVAKTLADDELMDLAITAMGVIAAMPTVTEAPETLQ